MDDARPPSLISAVRADSADFYCKGLVTLFEAISDIDRRRYSWAIVRLYYSVFYCLRASLAANGYGLIKNQAIHLLKVQQGEKPIKKSGGRYRNDHEAVVSIFLDLYPGETLQSNSVDDQNPYRWLAARRNQINYLQRAFVDPDPPMFASEFSNWRESKSINDLLVMYSENLNICFQPEHAWLAIPFRRALSTRIDLLSQGIRVDMDELRGEHLLKLVGRYPSLITLLDGKRG